MTGHDGQTDIVIATGAAVEAASGEGRGGNEKQRHSEEE
jgi:hypothetical protein